jgi:acetolactate synthase-1/2/3 large subunit
MRSYQPPFRGHTGQIRKAVEELLQNAQSFIVVAGLYKAMLPSY